MRSKLKEIDSLCHDLPDVREDDARFDRIKAIVADLLVEDWDCTLQALEVIQYRNALDEIATKADHSWPLANIARNAIAEADRVRDGQPMTQVCSLVAEQSKAEPTICAPCDRSEHSHCTGYGCACYIAGQVGPWPQEGR